MILKQPWDQERMFEHLQKEIFSILEFLSDEAKTIFWKSEAFKLI